MGHPVIFVCYLRNQVTRIQTGSEKASASEDALAKPFSEVPSPKGSVLSTSSLQQLTCQLPL